MLVGEYQHSLDDKNRVSLPAKFRAELGKRVVVTKGLDGCLFVYSESEWLKFAEKLSDMPMGQSDTRAFNRFMLGSAGEVDVDSSGRILIPSHLTEFAALSNQIVLAGVMTRVELWNTESWKTYTNSIEHKADTLAEKLGDIGMI